MADRWLIPTLTALVGLTGASCLQLVFVPLGPTATALPPRPGQTFFNLGVSATERIQLRPSPGAGPVIELSRTALAVRQPKHLDVAALTATDPSLALQQRRLLQVANGEIALGAIGDQTALQGCRTASGRSVITGQAFRRVPRPSAITAEKVRRLLGLSPISTSTCQLFTLTTAPGPGAEARLKAAWEKI